MQNNKNIQSQKNKMYYHIGFDILYEVDVKMIMSMNKP